MGERPVGFHSSIYLITCIHPDSCHKRYVGQVQSHVLNHGKFRLYGIPRRWAQHVSEASVNNSARQCWKLNNAIRKYGAENFDVEDLGPCDPEMADIFERLFIKTYDSIKCGYNITEGGKGVPLGEESRRQISRSKTQAHDEQRLEDFRGVEIIRVTLSKFLDKGVNLTIVGTKDGKPFTRRTKFYGTQVTFDDAMARSSRIAMSLTNRNTDIIVIKRLPQLRLDRQDCQIAGTPLELE